MRPLAVACLLLLAPSALAQTAPRIPLVPQAGPLSSMEICGGTRPVTLTPIIATHTQPPYPTLSQRLGEQGTTTLRVQVAPDGTVADDSVLNSSGSATLDTAALDFVKQNYRWQPLSCKTNAATVLRIVWSVRPPAPPLDPALIGQVMHIFNADAGDWPDGSAKMARRTGIILVLRDDGALGQVVIIGPSGDPAIDRKSEEILRRHRWQAAQMDGKSQGGFLFFNVVWTPPPGSAAPTDNGDLAKLQQLFPPAPPPQ